MSEHSFEDMAPALPEAPEEEKKGRGKKGTSPQKGKRKVPEPPSQKVQSEAEETEEEEDAEEEESSKPKKRNNNRKRKPAQKKAPRITVRTSLKFDQDEEEDRRKRAKIRAYKKAFPGLEHLTAEKVDSLKGEELEELLNDIRHTVSSRSSVAINRFLFENGAAVVEGALCTFTPVRAQGFRKNLFSNPAFTDALTEHDIENSDWDYKPPAERLVQIAGAILLQTHRENTMGVVRVERPDVSGEIDATGLNEMLP